MTEAVTLPEAWDDALALLENEDPAFLDVLRDYASSPRDANLLGNKVSALIMLGVCASAANLDEQGVRHYAREAVDTGPHGPNWCRSSRSSQSLAFTASPPECPRSWKNAIMPAFWTRSAQLNLTSVQSDLRRPSSRHGAAGMICGTMSSGFHRVCSNPIRPSQVLHGAPAYSHPKRWSSSTSPSTFPSLTSWCGEDKRIFASQWSRAPRQMKSWRSWLSSARRAFTA